jgi:hypothetical protein
MPAPRLIPRQVLFGNPDKTSPALSPDGTRLAYLSPWNGVLNIWEGPLDGGEHRPVTRDEDRGIRQYRWAESGRHLLYLQDRGGNENWRLHAVDLVTGTERDLTPFDEVQVQLVDTHRDFPGEVLIAMNREDRRFHDVYRLTLDSGQLELEVKNPGNVAGSGYLVDASFQVRGAWASTPDAGAELLLRDTAGAPWRVVARWDADDSLGSRPVGFSQCGDYLYLLDSRQADTAQLVKLHTASLDWHPTPNTTWRAWNWNPIPVRCRRPWPCGSGPTGRSSMSKWPGTSRTCPGCMTGTFASSAATVKTPPGWWPSPPTTGLSRTSPTGARPARAGCSLWINPIFWSMSFAPWNRWPSRPGMA